MLLKPFLKVKTWLGEQSMSDAFVVELLLWLAMLSAFGALWWPPLASIAGVAAVVMIALTLTEPDDD